MKIAEPISKLFLACVLAVGMGAAAGGLVRAITPEAKAQGQQCVFGTPQWDGWDVKNGTVTNHFSRVVVPCNGGILNCRGKVTVYLWTWDWTLGLWVPYGAIPSAVYEPVPTLCGSNFSYTTYTSDASFPSGVVVRQELLFYERTGTKWTLRDIGYHDFIVP